MRCPLPPTDWGTVIMWGLLMSGVALTAGMLIGQKMGKPKNWSEPEEPPDPPPASTE